MVFQPEFNADIMNSYSKKISENYGPPTLVLSLSFLVSFSLSFLRSELRSRLLSWKKGANIEQ